MNRPPSQKSDKSTGPISRPAVETISRTPSIDLINQRLGTSLAPRMLTRSEIDLLRQCAKEAMEVAEELLTARERRNRPAPTQP